MLFASVPHAVIYNAWWMAIFYSHAPAAKCSLRWRSVAGGDALRGVASHVTLSAINARREGNVREREQRRQLLRKIGGAMVELIFFVPMFYLLFSFVLTRGSGIHLPP
jgi:hypothetical protein